MGFNSGFKGLKNNLMSTLEVRIYGASPKSFVVHSVKFYNTMLMKYGILPRFTIDYSFRMSHKRI